jgi:hypothetical protein
MAACAALAAWVACADDLPRRPSEPALHAVHSSTIRARMAQLEQLTLGDLPGAMGGAGTRRDIARVASELSETAAQLPDLVANVEMDSEDRSHFIVFADALRGRASRLAADAPTASPEILASRLDDLTETCAVCHQAFRVLSPEELR